MTPQPRIIFSEYFRKLDVDERVEALVREVIIGQSELHTLTSSYKLVINSHGKVLDKTKTEVDENLQNKVAGVIEQLQELSTKINSSIDVVEVNEAFQSFQVLYESLKQEDEEEQELKKSLLTLRKLNERFLQKTQSRLDEYCQRIMVMAEAQRDRKRNFDDNMEKEKLKMRGELMSDVITSFQKMRVDKLKTFADGIEENHFKRYNAKLDEYKNIIEKHKVLSQHVFQLENQLRATKFEKRKIPYDHDREIEDLTKTVASYDIMIEELDEKLKAANIMRVNSVVFARREKKTLNLHLSKLLSDTARKHAKLCKISHQAIRKHLKTPQQIMKKICKNPEDCTCALSYSGTPKDNN